MVTIQGHLDSRSDWKKYLQVKVFGILLLIMVRYPASCSQVLLQLSASRSCGKAEESFASCIKENDSLNSHSCIFLAAADAWSRKKHILILISLVGYSESLILRNNWIHVKAVKITLRVLLMAYYSISRFSLQYKCKISSIFSPTNRTFAVLSKLLFFSLAPSVRINKFYNIQVNCSFGKDEIF